MKLWTFQGVGHSLTEGRIDLARSPYRESVTKYDVAIGELARRIEPSGQFIWCLTREVEWYEVHPLDKYVLDVSPSDFLAVLDGPVWERLLGTTSVPDSLCDRWRSEWDFDTHKVGCTDYCELKRREYLMAVPPKEVLWQSLILDVPTPESSVLLKHPIPVEWIISRERYESPLLKDRLRTTRKSEAAASSS